MENEQLLTELRTIAEMVEHPVLAQRLADLQRKIELFIREKDEMQAVFQEHLDNLRHDLAQPVTGIRVYLELIPEVLKEEKAMPGRMAKPEFWEQRYRGVLDSCNCIVSLLRKAAGPLSAEVAPKK